MDHSENYEMTLKPGTQVLDGRDCYVLAIDPKRKAPNLIVGSLWVDAKDGIDRAAGGRGIESAVGFCGSHAHDAAVREVDGFSMATHARAESSTFLYGRTVVTIDYSGYNIDVRLWLGCEAFGLYSRRSRGGQPRFE